jgi:hypothetical protein
MWTGFIRLRVGTMISSDSLKCRYFLTGRGTDTFSKRTLLRRCSFCCRCLRNPTRCCNMRMTYLQPYHPSMEAC